MTMVNLKVDYDRKCRRKDLIVEDKDEDEDDIHYEWNKGGKCMMVVNGNGDGGVSENGNGYEVDVNGIEDEVIMSRDDNGTSVRDGGCFFVCEVCHDSVMEKELDGTNYKGYKPILGDEETKFICSNCTEDGESAYFVNEFRKPWVDIAFIALLNLKVNCSKLHNLDMMFFHLQNDICKFVYEKFDYLCIGYTRNCWKSNLASVMNMYPSFFEHLDGQQGKGWWRLKEGVSKSPRHSQSQKILPKELHKNATRRRNSIFKTNKRYTGTKSTSTNIATTLNKNLYSTCQKLTKKKFISSSNIFVTTEEKNSQKIVNYPPRQDPLNSFSKKFKSSYNLAFQPFFSRYINLPHNKTYKCLAPPIFDDRRCIFTVHKNNINNCSFHPFTTTTITDINPSKFKYHDFHMDNNLSNFDMTFNQLNGNESKYCNQFYNYEDMAAAALISMFNSNLKYTP